MFRVQRRRKLLRTLAALTLTATSALAVSMSQQTSATAEPGVPELAPILWGETFENGLADGQLEMLPNYTGAGGTTYTADPYWVNPEWCNGMVMDGTTSDDSMSAAGCDWAFRGDARGWATSLGDFHGDNAEAAPANHVLAEWTYHPLGEDLDATPAPFLRSSPIAVTPGHYLAIGLNYVVDANCVAVADPHVVLALEYQGEVHDLTGSDLCGAGEPGTLGARWRVPADVAEIRYVLRNTQPSGDGNDYAVDDLVIRDLTPQLDQTFDPTKATTGDPVTMTYTVTNTGDPDAGEPIAAKTDFSFRDLLPTGLRIIELGDTTCGDGVLSEDPEGTVAFEGGDLADGQKSCTITLTVTADEAGTYGNGQVYWSTNGVLPFHDVSVTFVDPADPGDDDPDDDTGDDTGDDTDEDDDPNFVAPDTGSTR